MLRNVLERYIENLTEREFDAPLLALLPALGFYDIHFVHGNVEFGKDIIAKKIDETTETQYIIQSKVGDIAQADFRNNIMGQLLEASVITLSHPNFNTNIPRKVILVTTGTLNRNAALATQNFNNELVNRYRCHPIEYWEGPRLVENFEEFGLTGLFGVTVTGIQNFASFYTLYAQCLTGEISEREIENYTRIWTDRSIDEAKRLLRASIEAGIVSQQCITQGRIYEAIFALLGFMRYLCWELYSTENTQKVSEIRDIYIQTVLRIIHLLRQYINDFKEVWYAASERIVSTSPQGIMTYLVNCSRILEITSLLYFISDDNEEKAQAVQFLQELINKEVGCYHPASDRYTVGLVATILSLYKGGLIDRCIELIRKIAGWLFDRYENGIGLASVDANEFEETGILMGYALDIKEVHPLGGSLLATALIDLTAFLMNQQLYSDLINDVKATGITHSYWQPKDTDGLFFVEGEDVIQYPNIEYSDNIGAFSDFDYAEHIREETRNYRIIELLDKNIAIILMLFLRDRYFPSLWTILANH